MVSVTVILEFLNTLNLTAGTDVLSDPPRLADWLRQEGEHEDLNPSLQDVASATELREAIRDLASSNGSGGRPAPAAYEVVDRASRTAAIRLRFSQGRAAELEATGPGLEGAVAGMLVALHTVMESGEWAKIKICRNPACRWAYFDRSRNHSRVWCEMAECGNRMKARRFRKRRREQPEREKPEGRP